MREKFTKKRKKNTKTRTQKEYKKQQNTDKERLQKPGTQKRQ